MSDTIKITHNGVEIVYNEKSNRFDFELRGRCRSAESLKSAKDSIDAPVKDKAKPFTRVRCYRLRYSDWETGEVTSIAESSSYSSSRQVWFVSDGQRTKTKEYVHCLYPINEQSDELVSRHKALSKQMVSINDERNALAAKIKSLVLPKEEA